MFFLGLNNAIKIILHAVQKTSLKFAEAVRTLFIFLHMRDTGALYKDHLNVLKTTYVHDIRYAEILEKAGKVVTEHSSTSLWSAEET